MAPSFFGAGFAVLVPDPAVAGRPGFAARGDFAAFDEVFCDGFAVRFPVCLVFAALLALFAAGLRVFEGVIFAAAAALARLAFPAEAPEDFARVFLDIRLPFVAFRGSIIGVLMQIGIKPPASKSDRFGVC